MLTVIIPTLNAEASLAATLSALVPGVVNGVVRQVIVVDGGSSDQTLKIADAAGADILRSNEPGRGPQLIAGANAAKSRWFLFLHADTVLQPDWDVEAATFIERIESGERPEAAGVFRFALDDTGCLPRLIEMGVSVRCDVFRMPYGDQGLLIPRRLYDTIGGYRPLPLMEDVDIISRLARRHTVMLRSRAVTSAVRYRADGYVMRVLRNWGCLILFYLHVPTRYIARLYG